jgi:hypothetical protein
MSAMAGSNPGHENERAGADLDQAARSAAAAFERLPELVNANDSLVRRGRFLTTDCLISIGAVPFHVSIVEGRIGDFHRGPRLMKSWIFAVRASAPAWTRFWQPVPDPGWHDLFALTKRGEASLEGDLRPLMANLQYMKDVLAAPRLLSPAG